MSGFGWPQWVVLVWMAITMLLITARVARNRSLSSAKVTGFIFLWLAYYAGSAAVLHAGGFW